MKAHKYIPTKTDLSHLRKKHNLSTYTFADDTVRETIEALDKRPGRIDSPAFAEAVVAKLTALGQTVTWAAKESALNLEEFTSMLNGFEPFSLECFYTISVDAGLPIKLFLK